MFSKKNLFLIVIASAFAVSISANAADDEHHGEMKSCKGHKSGDKCSMMLKMDADNDGNISLKEFMSHHRDMFDKADTNGDRLIDEDEMKAMMKHMHGHGHKHEHKHDDDDNGHDHDH